MNKVTKEQLLAWLGSDVTKDVLVSVLLELATGEYDIEAFQCDVLYYEGESK